MPRQATILVLRINLKRKRLRLTWIQIALFMMALARNTQYISIRSKLNLNYYARTKRVVIYLLEIKIGPRLVLIGLELGSKSTPFQF